MASGCGCAVCPSYPVPSTHRRPSDDHPRPARTDQPLPTQGRAPRPDRQRSPAGPDLQHPDARADGGQVERGAHVTTLTLSREQAALAQQRVREAGVAHLVDIRLQDYREAEGTYDAVVSVEMIEAVGDEYW